MHLPDAFYKNRKLENLVENQTSYTLNNAAMHVFETHQQAERVLLQFDKPVLASMLHGKKIMHLRDHNSFAIRSIPAKKADKKAPSLSPIWNYGGLS